MTHYSCIPNGSMILLEHAEWKLYAARNMLCKHPLSEDKKVSNQKINLISIKAIFKNNIWKRDDLTSLLKCNTIFLRANIMNCNQYFGRG